MHALVLQISTDFIQTIFKHLVTYSNIFIFIRVPVHTFLLQEGNLSRIRSIYKRTRYVILIKTLPIFLDWS